MKIFKKKINHNDIEYEPQSIVDDSGKVFYYQNRVFRGIFKPEKSLFYKKLLCS